MNMEDGGKIFFTSDLHFGHANIINYCKRPFDSADHMNQEIIRRWNERVAANDLVYILGDVCMGNVQHTSKFVGMLSGRKILVRGNHDKKSLNLPEFRQHFEEVHDYLELKDNHQLFVLCHYPMASWNGAHRGSYMLHGHSHHGYYNGRPDTLDCGRILDVGIDGRGYDYSPLSMEQVRKIMDKKSFLQSDGHDE